MTYWGQMTDSHRKAYKLLGYALLKQKYTII
ncbi:MAG: hypothetical protein JWP94_3665 [Mucilaginibacter sp.]|nr:hypothetical protein [Mucilaginibacter sp.]